MKGGLGDHMERHCCPNLTKTQKYAQTSTAPTPCFHPTQHGIPDPGSPLHGHGIPSDMGKLPPGIYKYVDFSTWGQQASVSVDAQVETTRFSRCRWRCRCAAHLLQISSGHGVLHAPRAPPRARAAARHPCALFLHARLLHRSPPVAGIRPCAAHAHLQGIVRSHEICKICTPGRGEGRRDGGPLRRGEVSGRDHQRRFPHPQPGRSVGAHMPKFV